jgi:pimeloyl-ACP methyl ester carboxylesterase
MPLRAPRLAVWLLALAVLPGCAILDSPVIGVDRVGSDEVDGELNQNALTGDEPSASTLEALHYYGLTDCWETTPDDALLRLHRAVLAEPERPFLHALAELNYLRARELKDRDRFLAAAVYAWFYLLGESDLEPANPYDRRFRWACDLYNRGLREAFLAEDGQSMHLEGGRRTLPVGNVEIEYDHSMFPYDDADFAFVPADDYSVWGLSVRLRDSGLGAPLVGTSESVDAHLALARFQPRKLRVPATIFLRVSGRLADLERGIGAKLELHSAYDPREVHVAGKSVPLESDFTAALALGLNRSNIWGFSTRGFFRGDETGRDNRLFFVRTPKPGLVPVVFVHGTASNPAYWAEMFNLLLAEPAIREHMQFWFFQYSTGSPIAFSAATLRREIRDLLAAIDPSGVDPALQRMVVVGHSQGGLLAKLMAVDSDMDWWNEIVGKPIESLGFPPDQEALLRSAIDFDPVPQVKRVVYMSTPHRGSFQADRTLSRWIAKLIALPGELAGVNESLVRNASKLPKDLQPRIPTSLDNMRASNPFLQQLLHAPLAPGVAAHSIISIGSDGDPAHPEGCDDGIVEYSSAHIDGVDSEVRVPCGHSSQLDPRAIAEVRRILLLHLKGIVVLPTRPARF